MDGSELSGYKCWKCELMLILEDGIGQQQVVDDRLVDSSVSDLIADEVQPCSRTQPQALRQLSVASWRVTPSSAVIAAGSPVITVLLLSLHHYTI